MSPRMRFSVAASSVLISRQDHILPGTESALSWSAMPSSVTFTMTTLSSEGSREREMYPLSSSFLRTGVMVPESRHRALPMSLTVMDLCSHMAIMAMYWVYVRSSSSRTGLYLLTTSFAQTYSGKHS